MLTCARCALALTPGEGNFYLVRIVAVADPSPPRFTEEDLAGDVESEVESLLARVRGKSEEELMDQVYRREILYLCTPCYLRWIARPVADC